MFAPVCSLTFDDVPTARLYFTNIKPPDWSINLAAQSQCKLSLKGDDGDRISQSPSSPLSLLVTQQRADTAVTLQFGVFSNDFHMAAAVQGDGAGGVYHVGNGR